MNPFDEDESVDAIYAVQDYLSSAVVYEDEQRVGINRKKYTFSEISLHIAQHFSMKLSLIQSHVIGWLEMNYVPSGYNEEEMEEFESKIERWVESIEKQA